MARAALLAVLAGFLLPQEERIPWTASRIVGTPDPPPPYRLERSFARLKFDRPVEIVRSAELRRFFVVEQYGKIFSFPEEGDPAKGDLFADLKRDVRGWETIPDTKGPDQSFGLAFHPKFAENRFCYVVYTLGHKVKNKNLPDGSRVSRFRVTEGDPPRIDPASELVVIRWLEGGHNGCCLRFGPDGFLYISTGDATPPNPPDALDTGQDVTDLLSSILRIDVDRTEGGKAYAVPPDNPLLSVPGARPEIWAYGFRNPWRMSFDAAGNLWVGDVGWELWELLFCVERGGNYGWSAMEGPQPVNLNGKRGPTPILPPAMALPHTEAASITGGYVYRGRRLPELAGRYVFADYELFRLFDARVEGKKLLERRDLGRTEERVVAMAEDRDGELLFLDHAAGGIHRLVPNDQGRHNPDFPRKLSGTGLFASAAEEKPAPGVYSYSIAAQPWADHAGADRFMGLPGTETIRADKGFKAFPKDMVLAKTLSLEMERGKPASRRRIETQVLHFDGRDWQPYTYAWDEAQADATLVEARGAERLFTVADPEAPGGKREQRWTFHARATCAGCHIVSWPRYLQGFNDLQLGPQVERFRRLGILPARPSLLGGPEETTPVRNPYDRGEDLALRARSYLHVNCAVCHRPGGGGTSQMDLRRDKPPQNTHALGVRPALGDFGIADAYIVAGGDPSRSTLFYRMAKSGHGRMPYVGSAVVDREGLELVARWIESLPAPPASPVRAAERELLRRLKAGEPAAERLLASTSGALDVVRALDAGELPEGARREVLERAMKAPDAVRGLFERFVPPERRPKRLGQKPDPALILAAKGDAGRGRRLFFESTGLQCRNCHELEGRGESYGPDLSKIGQKSGRAALLESILSPSKQVDPRFATWAVRTADGAVHTGLLLEKTDRVVVLKDAQRREIRIPAGSVAQMKAQETSAMPEFLIQDLAAEEAADLLEFLAGLR
jgi:putative heme-binding domain-containing protein